MQLERILLSETFRRQEKPARLLQRLVTDALTGAESDEYRLGIDLFNRLPDWAPLEDNLVRQHMTRLRKLLDAYYRSEGIEDRLDLELRGYKALFSYNPRHPVERAFRLALKHLATDPNVTFSYLDQVLGIEPDHAEALAARGEAELWRTMNGNEVDVLDLLSVAEARAGQALAFDGDCWRARIVLGAVHCCKREWSNAQQRFATAVARSPDRAKFHPWYAAFLMATGRTDEALELTATVASAPPVSPWPLLTHAIFLYAARRFPQARRVILQAKQEQPDVWLSHVVWSCVLRALDRNSSTVPLLGMSLPQSLPDGTTVYTAISLYENLSRLSPDELEYTALRGLLRAWIDEKERAAAPDTDDEPPPFRIVRVAPFHLAIGYMALGDHQRAIALLRRDLERGHPLMVWLHLWPLFDPLREVPEFQHLIAEMNLPGAH